MTAAQQPRNRRRRIAIAGAVLAGCGCLTTGCASGGDSGAASPAPPAVPGPTPVSGPAAPGPATTPVPTTAPDPTTTRAGSPSAGPGGGDPSCPGPVPPALRLSSFYDRYCSVDGIPLVADEAVEPRAMRSASGQLRQLLRHRPDVARALADGPVRVGLIGRDQQTTDLPEWSDLNTAFPGTDWDARTRGVGATAERPLVGAGEENVLCLPGDRYAGESIFVHEVSHTILQFGVEVVDPGFRSRLVRAYDQALAAGRWSGTYAATNVDEYWAEAVQSWFDANASGGPSHGEVDTRAELARYDPPVAGLIAEVFGSGAWRPTCPG